jgi:CRISPR-associated protein Cas2
MVVIILERVSPSLRGELTRWLLEPRTGVFVGRVSALVRDKLWEHICRRAGVGGALLIHPTDTEQGYALRSHGATSRTIGDFEGLTLIHIP